MGNSKRIDRDEVSLSWGGSDRRSRRQFLRGSGILGAVALAASVLGPGLAGCETKPSPSDKGRPISLGIWAGTQTLWRYLAQRQDALFKPLGHEVVFENMGSEEELRGRFLGGSIDVIATLPAQLPSLADSGVQVQFFSPISWMKEGYPLLVPASSSASSLGDLQGRTVAVFPATTPGVAYWRALALANYGFRLEEKVRLVESAQPEMLLESGQAEAAIVASPAWAALRAKGTYRSLGDLAAEWRKASRSERVLMYGGFAARKDWVQGHQAFVEDCLRVVREAVAQYQRDKKVILEAATAYAGENVPAVAYEANAAVGAYLGLEDTPPDRAYVSPQDVEDHRPLFSLLAKTGYVKAEPKQPEQLFYLSKKRPP